MMFGDGFYLMRNLIYKMLPKSYCASSPIGHPLRYHDFILNPLKEFAGALIPETSAQGIFAAGLNGMMRGLNRSAKAVRKGGD